MGLAAFILRGLPFLSSVMRDIAAGGDPAT